MATKKHLTPGRNSLPPDYRILGLEGIVITNFSQTEDVPANLPTVQSQSNLLISHEPDQQDE
ncbi:hypothetical protein BGX21_004893, partial [Mortierella sp. AD011]